jgi:hypothetical protein
MIKNKKAFFFLLFFSFLFFSFLSSDVLAGGNDVLGVDVIDSDIVLESADPRQIAARVINIFLGLLGVIAVGLIIYGGFIWMTSEGNEEKVSKAKNILKSAVIGLAIILSAWGIVLFIFGSLTDTSTVSTPPPSPQSVFFQSGFGAMGACTIESVYPENGQKAVPRNTIIMITFKEEVSPETVNSSNVSICREENFNVITRECEEGEVGFVSETNDNHVFVLYPEELLGDEDGFYNYAIYFSSNVLNFEETESIFSSCSSDYFSWGFEVSNALDLTPPKISSVFPQPDNFQDEVVVSSELAFASASIEINNVGGLNYFQPAEIISINLGGGTGVEASGSIGPNYNGQYTNFEVVAVSSNSVQLKSGTDILGVYDVLNNKVSFPNYFNLEFEDSFNSGNSWQIEVERRVQADTITVGGSVYTFVSGNTSDYNIKLDNEYSPSDLAEQIAIALNNHPNAEPTWSTGSSIVSLEAKVGGSNGNNIALSTSNSGSISITPFSGGSNNQTNTVIKDKRDKPMNSVIQINFNEAINPITVSGESDEVSDYIRVVNNKPGSQGNGSTCSENNHCSSFNCDTSSNTCLGDYLAGKFSISPNYRTVEFTSSFQCGVNGCGGEIYCLPENSNIRVEIEAATLFDCGGDNSQCANKSPFSNCVENTGFSCPPGQATCYFCQNEDGKRYPLSDLSLMDGVLDAAGNSLDGNSDGYSYGPVSYFHKNDSYDNTGDNYSWSFWINDKIETDPPKLNYIYPDIGSETADLYLPIEIGFNKLMMSSSLRTGEVVINNGFEDITHRLINLIGGQLVGYWITSENLDVAPIDGEPDQTKAYLNHAKFFEGAGYNAQVGSGVLDIYQNCFKPSSGPQCDASPTIPFCCDGVPSSTYCQ